MSSVIDAIERGQLRKGLPSFEAGDRVRVHFQVIEGSRRRTQVFEGVVLKRQGSGARETFTVRKQSFGVGVERTFPLHSPKIEKLEIAARGDVRRAKLYYLRGRIGKAARVAERRWGIDEELIAAPPAAGEEQEALDAEGTTQSEAAAEEAPEPPEGEEAQEEAPDGEEAQEEAPEGEETGAGVEDASTDGEETTAAGESTEAEGEDSTAKGEGTSEEPSQSEDPAPSEEQPDGEQGEADPPAAESEPSKPADDQDSD